MGSIAVTDHRRRRLDQWANNGRSSAMNEDGRVLTSFFLAVEGGVKAEANEGVFSFE